MQLHIPTQILPYQPIAHTTFATKLINWYIQNKRVLPWRETKDPYKIWLSEIILQQTRVAQGLPYYLKFIQKFPDIHTLAQTDEQTILQLWQGLGYYSRARNLWQCAQQIVLKYQGVFPKNWQALLSLKGIGQYTAAAIASFAFQMPFAVVDGNVYRVLARIFGLKQDIALFSSQKFFQNFAQELLPKNKNDVYNQAIMEFGAIHCMPQKPLCSVCIFQQNCFAYSHQQQHILPHKTKKIKIKERFFYYFIFQWHDTFFLKKRTEKDIWLGLYDFYLFESAQKTDLATIQNKKKFLKNKYLSIHIMDPPQKHLLTHQKLYCCFFHVEIKKKNPFFLDQNIFHPYSTEEIKLLPKPIILENFLKKHKFLSKFTAREQEVIK